MATEASESACRSVMRMSSSSDVGGTRCAPLGLRGSSADASAGPSPPTSKGASSSRRSSSAATPLSAARRARAIVAGVTSAAAPSSRARNPGGVTAARSDTNSAPESHRLQVQRDGQAGRERRRPCLTSGGPGCRRVGASRATASGARAKGSAARRVDGGTRSRATERSPRPRARPLPRSSSRRAQNHVVDETRSPHARGERNDGACTGVRQRLERVRVGDRHIVDIADAALGEVRPRDLLEPGRAPFARLVRALNGAQRTGEREGSLARRRRRGSCCDSTSRGRRARGPSVRPRSRRGYRGPGPSRARVSLVECPSGRTRRHVVARC